MGLLPGELAVVTGAPGVGKSSFALNIASKAAISGEGVLLVSLEADAETAFLRMCAADARVDACKILTGRLSESDWASIADASARLGGSGMRICDEVRLTSEGLRREIRGLGKVRRASLVVSDGIELAADLVGSNSDRLPIRERAVELKRLAMDGSIPVVATVGYGPGSKQIAAGYEGVLKALPDGVGGVADTVVNIYRHLTQEGPADPCRKPSQR